MRRVAASLLAVLLFCGTSWAAVCDLSCQFNSMKTVCADASMDQGAMPMACDHCQGNDELRGSLQVASSACAPMQCGHAVVASERASDEAFTLLASPVAMVADQITVAIPELESEPYRQIRPPGDGSAFYPLFVSLRV
ncbi:hypothetical protein [Granulicella arctica]|uniref:hypothetical protein n=1 Tax=Granulicella arctica TaxID=940613 RepID=UPI0021E0DF78|nr:hypothetical protein [Granulicella arctica]